MTVISLIPSGFYQFYYAVQKGCGLHAVRKLQQVILLKTTSWLRIGPDIIFAGGAVLLVLFLIKGIWFSFIRKR